MSNIIPAEHGRYIVMQHRIVLDKQWYLVDGLQEVIAFATLNDLNQLIPLTLDLLMLGSKNEGIETPHYAVYDKVRRKIIFDDAEKSSNPSLSSKTLTTVFEHGYHMSKNIEFYATIPYGDNYFPLLGQLSIKH